MNVPCRVRFTLQEGKTRFGFAGVSKRVQEHDIKLWNVSDLL